ncbi:MAG: hypothetical protein K9W44_08545 [Candidatus Lokiarchaeota archaeon]|nr:hypothetical protein [Candidatus Harpocratesius repetitus]
MGIKIIMDERERGEIRSQMQSLPIDLEIQTLDFGDYIISSRCAIERKRGDDFVSSIFDQRLFLQLEKLKNAYPHPIMILENPKRLFERKFVNPKAIYGALIYVSTRLQIPVIPTKDEVHTANILFQLAKKEQENETFGDDIFVPQIFTDGIVSRGDQEYFIQGLVDVGIQRANQFLDFFQTPEHILYAFELTNVSRTKSGKPKGISGVLGSISGIGPKLVERNKILLHYSYKQAKKEKRKTKII